MSTRAKRFEYGVTMEGDGAVLADGTERMNPGEAWTPEHLLLAGLVRCSMNSLRYHATRLGATVTGTADAAGVVTRREEDGRFGLVEATAVFDVVVEPVPEDPAVLVAKAERDCFVGASLAVAPTYRWTVNGVTIGH